MGRDILADRRAERERLIGVAREFVRRLSERIPVLAAYVAGSVARGDFNVWSDIDVVVVAEGLPERLPERQGALMADALPGVQPVGYTPEEFEAARVKGNRLVVEALERGVVLISPGITS